MNLSKIAAAAIPFALAATNAFSAGFGLYEFSARGNALGGAVMAGPAEPASLALNPALITDLKGSQIQLGVTEVTALAQATYNGQTATPNRAWWTLPTFFYTQELTERWYAGIGVFPRFGLSNEYPDKNWAGATSTYKVGVESFSVQPTVAYQVTDRLSAAAALEVMYFKFEKGNRVTPAMGGIDLNVEGDSIGLAPMVALAYKANEKVNFGVSYRFRIKQALDGTATYNTQAPMFQNGDANGTINLPAQIAFGVSYRPIEKLLIEFNWMNIFWSSFDEIAINFDKMPRSPSTSGTKSEKKEWKDTFRIGMGAEYTLSKVVTLRGSYIFDKAPVNNDYMDVMIPVNDRHLFGVGAGLNLFKDVVLDLSYTYLIGTSLSGTTDPGPSGIPVSYKNGSSHLMGASVKYKF
ncbi:MAG: outer membrane protein transport protein [Elusimicrobiota bacterium]|jgi:long-chain fatty acid transport protein|nr:outer membrane protein transport protein [Elusimicrobiota bacterium]